MRIMDKPIILNRFIIVLRQVYSSRNPLFQPNALDIQLYPHTLHPNISVRTYHGKLKITFFRRHIRRRDNKKVCLNQQSSARCCQPQKNLDQLKIPIQSPVLLFRTCLYCRCCPQDFVIRFYVPTCDKHTYFYIYIQLNILVDNNRFCHRLSVQSYFATEINFNKKNG